MPTPAEVEELAQETSAWSTLAIAALVGSTGDLPADPVEAAALVREIAEAASLDYGRAAVGGAIDFYSSVRPPASPRFAPRAPEPRAIEAGTLNWMTEPLVEMDDLEASMSRTAAAIEKEILASVVEAIGEATQDDPLDVRFCRFPAGDNPCAWCVLRASRGALYWSEASATAGDHLKCRCRVTAVFADEPLPYLRAPYMQQYLDGAAEADGPGRKALLAGMRRANGIR